MFLKHSCSKSFKEVKKAIKNQFFLCLGPNLVFNKKKTRGRILVPAVWPGEKYWVGVHLKHGCTLPRSGKVSS